MKKIASLVNIQFVSLAAIGLLVAACGSDHKPAQPAAAQSQISPLIPTTLEISVAPQAKLSPTQQSLLQLIQTKKSVDHNLLTQAIIERHYAEYVAREDKAHSNVPAEARKLVYLKRQSELNALLANKMNASNPNALKVAYEKELVSNFVMPKGKAIQYYGKATNVFDAFDSQIQCYSGTILHELFLRSSKNAPDFEAAHYVVIFQSGHVLPGYMTKESDGRWYLSGVETTVSGAGFRDFGAAADLDQPIRVITATDFATLQAFEPVMKSDTTAKVMKQALKHAATLYGINLDKTESRVADASKQFGDEKIQKGKSALNSSLMAFGYADVPETPVDRAQEPEDFKVMRNTAPAHEEKRAEGKIVIIDRSHDADPIFRAMERADRSRDEEMAKQEKEAVQGEMIRAIENKDEKTVEGLIKEGVDVNARFYYIERNDVTFLHAAAKYGSNSIVKLLLENKADPNAIDAKGESPLDWALTGFAPADVVMPLVNAGADVNKKDKDGQTILSRMQKSDSSEIRAFSDELAKKEAARQERSFRTEKR